MNLLFTIFALSAGFQHTKINIGNTGNQNHPDLKVRVVLVTCISNIDYLEAGNQPIMQKWSILTRDKSYIRPAVRVLHSQLNPLEWVYQHTIPENGQGMCVIYLKNE